jgi:hypothetical protein
MRDIHSFLFTSFGLYNGMRENRPTNLPNTRCATCRGYPGFGSLFFLTVDRLRGASKGKKRLLGERIDRAADTRREIQAAARRRGYDRRCTEAIPTCGGECCRWHFPRTLSAADVVIMTWQASATDVERLRTGIIAAKPDRCPLHTPRGCRLSCDRRPMACANAFPCFAGESYHRFTIEKMRRLQPVLTEIEKILNGV